jgi:hypothetical protein
MNMMKKALTLLVLFVSLGLANISHALKLKVKPTNNIKPRKVQKGEAAFKDNDMEESCVCGCLLTGVAVGSAIASKQPGLACATLCAAAGTAAFAATSGPKPNHMKR